MPNTVKIDRDTYAFEEGDVRFFLLIGAESALLIDSGRQTRNAKEITSGYTGLPLSLLNTHADPDHIGSNAEFGSFYMHPAECAGYYRRGGVGASKPIWDGQILELGGRPLCIIEMPGHTPGSVAVLDIKNKRLFSGDPVQDGRIFMFGDGRDMHAYLQSLERLWSFNAEFDEVYPSHGSMPLKPSVILSLIDAAKEILSGKAAGTAAEVFGKPVVGYDMGAAVFLCDA